MHVVLPDGRDLGDVTDPHALAYYRGEGATVTDPDAIQDPAVIPPAESAHKAAWVSFALSVAPDRADEINGMTKDDLITSFG